VITPAGSPGLRAVECGGLSIIAVVAYLSWRPATTRS
jgi:hypothetical protein